MIRRVWTRVLQLSQTKRNLVANIFGNGWAALIQLLVIPIYIHLLGEEAFGLYAFFLTVMGLIQLFDLGFSPTINRELARYSLAEDKADQARTLTHTMEVIYITLGVLLGTGIALASPFLANTWLKASKLDTAMVQTALLCMAVLVAVQWPVTFYQGGVNGLQKQTRLVTLQVLISVLKHGGGVIVLLMVPSILALLVWLIIATTIQTTLSAILLWKCLPASKTKPQLNLNALKPVRDFATGAALSSLAAIPLLQAAPILLSGSVSLTEYGYFSIATTYAGVLAMLYMPIFTAIYPRLTALVEQKDRKIELNFFRFSGQFMALIVIPVGLALATHSHDLLLIWQQNIVRANAIAPIASLFVAGNMLAGLSHIPYALQLAHGNTKIGLTITLILGLGQIPILLTVIQLYGVMGAACMYVLINLVSLVLGIFLTHTKVVPIDPFRWLFQNIIMPAVACVVVYALMLQVGYFVGPILNLVLITLSMLISAIVCALSMNLTRNWVLGKLRPEVSQL